ncbi:MAG: hypothetical protein ACOYL3_23645 [Desulfuromonadaceae bacterium]
MSHAVGSVLRYSTVRCFHKGGVDFHTDEGKIICYDIAEHCEGKIGLAIVQLEAFLFAMAGDKGTNHSEILRNVLAEKQSSDERAAIPCCIAFVRLSTKGVSKRAFSVESCHQLLIKMRVVAMAIIRDYAGKTKDTPYALKKFKALIAKAEIKYDLETLATKMFKLLKCLNSIELKIKLGSDIHERALFIAELCCLVEEMQKEE